MTELNDVFADEMTMIAWTWGSIVMITILAIAASIYLEYQDSGPQSGEDRRVRAPQTAPAARRDRPDLKTSPAPVRGERLVS